MAEQPRSDGPMKGAFDVIQRIVTIAVGILETRLCLIVIELEEERATLVQLLIMVGISLLLIMSGLMSLLLLIFFAVNPVWRLTVLAITTAILLLLAFVGVYWTLVKARRSTLLTATRRQLEIDRALLEKDQ